MPEPFDLLGATPDPPGLEPEGPVPVPAGRPEMARGTGLELVPFAELPGIDVAEIGPPTFAPRNPAVPLEPGVNEGTVAELVLVPASGTVWTDGLPNPPSGDEERAPAGNGIAAETVDEGAMIDTGAIVCKAEEFAAFIAIGSEGIAGFMFRDGEGMVIGLVGMLRASFGNEAVSGLGFGAADAEADTFGIKVGRGGGLVAGWAAAG